MRDSGFCGDVGESAIAIVAEEMRRGLAARRKAFQPRSIHQKNIEPAVVVVIVEGNAATRGFEQIFIFVLSAEDGFRIQAGFASYVEKADAKIGALGLLVWLFRPAAARNQPGRAIANIFSRDNTSAERLRDLQKCAA